MTPFMKLIRKILHKLLGRYYEGPRPPPRLVEEFRLWENLNDTCARETLVGYAAFLINQAYRDGFVRGYEWQERGWEGPAIEPEQLIEAETQDWSLADQNPRVRHILDNGCDPEDPLANVASPDKRRFVEAMARANGRWALPYEITHEDEDDEP